MAEDEGDAAGEGDEEDGGAEPGSIKEGADESGQTQPEEDAGDEPPDELKLVAAELVGGDEPDHGDDRHHEEHGADGAAKRCRFHLAEGERKRRAWQRSGDAGERNCRAGGHLDTGRAGYPKSAEERDCAGRGEAPHEQGDDPVACHRENGEARGEAERESDGAPAHGHSVGVIAFDDHIAKAHDLTDDDERPGSKARIDGHEGWSGHEGQADSQAALGDGPRG